MKITDENIVKKAEIYVEKMLAENLTEQIDFHNFKHAKYVSKYAEYIGENEGLNPDEITVIKLSALFHDTGYVSDPKKHEEISSQIAEKFLISNRINSEIIDTIKRCILDTKITEKPHSKLSEILRDADIIHIASSDYFKRIEKMRKERNNLSDKKISKSEFYKESVHFFRQHHFFTDFAEKEFGKGKEKNLKALIKKTKSKKKDAKKSKKKEKNKNYSRGVESMFRNTARMQINLSSIADNKSNILISVNTIIISITMSVLSSRFDEMPEITVPTIIILISSLVTIVFAILSTRPNISSGTFDKNNIKDKNINLLFFGNFYNMQLDEYEQALGELMKDNDSLYSTMIRDQYNLGKVLARKYKLLRVSYNVFMFGIIISVLSFIFTFMF